MWSLVFSITSLSPVGTHTYVHPKIVNTCNSKLRLCVAHRHLNHCHFWPYHLVSKCRNNMAMYETFPRQENQSTTGGTAKFCGSSKQ